MSDSSSKRFRVAFSFAGEKRAFVAQVAAILAKQFGEAAILYDAYHEAEFAHANLAFSLPDLYQKEANLIVSVFCSDYETNEWYGLEWRAIFALIKGGQEKPVMLTRFDHADGKGLHGLAGFVELDQKTPEQVATLILERLALNEGKAKDYYTIEKPVKKHPFNTTIPNNLPRLQYFFGRDADLQKIAAALAPEARGWGALIDGPGGIGKTTLAIRAAEMVPEGRFRRIIFLSSKVMELTADGQRALGHFVLPTYLEMLNAIARELEQPEIAKSLEVERSEVLLRTLRETEVLLVLDNLETLPSDDRDQLFAFLNRLPRGSSAIVTSRRRADAGAVSVRLDRLDWESAHDLIIELGKNFTRLAQASEQERRALYEETGGNPLLIRWVAGQLGQGRCKTMASALTFLRNAPAGNNPLEFIFGDLLDTFTPNETKILAALTHFTTPMETKFIAELAKLNLEATQGALSDLSTRALVLPDLEERCFTLVPMVADFLRRNRPEVVQEIGNRLEERAYALIVENGYRKHDRFQTLDMAWPTVAPALPLLIAGPNARLQTVCDALQDFLNFTGRWDERLSLNQQAETKAIAAGDHYSAGWRTYFACSIYDMRRQSADLRIYADRTAGHWKTARAGVREQAIAIQLRGHSHLLNQDYSAAASAYREALEMDQSLAPESGDVATDLTYLAIAERHSGDFDAAERDNCEALRISRVINYTEGITSITGNLANLALDRKDWNTAETMSQEALQLAEKLGRKDLIASNCIRIALVLLQQNKTAEALPYAQRAVDIYTHLRSPNLVRARWALKKCEEALEK